MNLLEKYKTMVTTPNLSHLSLVVDNKPSSEMNELPPKKMTSSRQ